MYILNKLLLSSIGGLPCIHSQSNGIRIKTITRYLFLFVKMQLITFILDVHHQFTKK